ncbi:hypothetical protein [Nonomuraea sp. SYSU D8015]|uniref:hypothetical protein n=1 Tax=Nonomuraea sp. SYSU D8015 TaxID=2593644 RepID=UPI001660458B|nr:hypothetical protein [Nonomuraea sp. SYSU D8015]
MAAALDTSATGEALEVALAVLVRAYGDAVTVMTGMSASVDVQAAVAGAARIGGLLRELEEDLARRRRMLVWASVRT